MLCSNLKADNENLPLVPPRRGEKLYMVPQGIRPVVQLTAIEVRHQAIMVVFGNPLWIILHTIRDRTRQAQQAAGPLSAHV